MAAVLLIITLMAATNSRSHAESPTVRVSIGGHTRGVAGHWALAKAIIQNRNDEEASSFAIVVPQGGSDIQFAASVVTPANTIREFQWPVWIPDQKAYAIEMDYLILDGDEDDGVIQRHFGEQKVRKLTLPNPAFHTNQPHRFCGWLTSHIESPYDLEMISRFLSINRSEMGYVSMVREFGPNTMDGYTEGLDSLDQLVITSSELTSAPATCDAVQLWVQQGGQALIMVDQTGPDVVSAILGDGFPLSVIDTTTTNSLALKSHATGPTARRNESDQVVQHTFDEPVSLVRAIVESGNTLWSSDGWPVLVELPVGNGKIYLSFMSAEAFLTPDPKSQLGYSVATNGQELRDYVFGQERRDDLVEEEVLIQSGASRIGYEIPSLLMAALVTLGFSSVLLIGGLLTIRNWRSESLLWVIPLLALVATVPAAVIGTTRRNVAPATIISHDIVHLVPGQTSHVVEGNVTFYQPEPQDVDVLMSDYSNLEVAAHPPSLSERMIWTGRGTGQWSIQQQPAGLQSHPVRSVLQLDQPAIARATFDENGLTGTLTTAGQFKPDDCVIAGLSPDFMTAKFQDDGRFVSTPDDVLPPGNFSDESLLSSEQIHRGVIYESLLRTRPDSLAFPQTPSLFFWSTALPSRLSTGTRNYRQENSTLVIQPITLIPPVADSRFVIPPVFLPYQAVVDKSGGISAVFGNRNRVWQRRNNPGSTLLEFSVPDACTPFDAESVTITLRITAGSREVSLSGGHREDLQLISTMQSPVGQFDIDYPAELAALTQDTGNIYLQIQVGEVDIEEEAATINDVRDDYWKIDRVMMTATGIRITGDSEDDSSTSGQAQQ